MSKGLRTVSTCLMGARANAIGGIHAHILFSLQTQNKNAPIYPYRAAELAMQKIMRKKLYHHAILTIDALFLDEAGQISAELLSVFDIIFRKMRTSSMPFGGALVFGTMDHAQLQPIKALPFLMSSLILTTFTMVQLKESVCASSDPDFREFQNILRMNPSKLPENPTLKERFCFLADTLFTYVPDMHHPSITPQMTRMYSCKNMVKSATAMYTELLIEQLHMNKTPYIIWKSIDIHTRTASASKYTPVSRSSIASLNNQCKEPQTLVFHKWGLCECTINDSSTQRKYN